MKKFIITCLTVITAISAQAQTENGVFNHLSIGINAGTPGAGIDLAMPITENFAIRAGYSLMPQITANTSLDLSGKVPTEVTNYYTGKTYNIPQQVDVEGKLKFGNAKVLVDIYPFKKSSFHVTAGAYIGNDDVVSLTNKTDLKQLYEANQDIEAYNKEVSAGNIPGGKVQKLIGVELGDYLLTADKNGKVEGTIKTKGFKPYAGLGFGRAVPHKTVGFMFEAGCMFWNSPQVFSNGKELTSENIGGEGGDILKTISKISIYPVVNFRLCFKAF